MPSNLQLGLLVVLIIALYVISSRRRPEDEAQRRVRISYWIGLAVALILVLLIALMGPKTTAP